MIVPAVIPETKNHLLETLELFGSFAHEVQIDITDGKFTSTRSWPYTEMETPTQDVFPNVPVGAIELDLMIQNPEESLDTWMQLHPTRIAVHVDSTTHLDAVVAHRQAHDYKLGLALGMETDIEWLQTLAPGSFDYVELMGIAEIGAQGQSFDERVLNRIRMLRTMYPELEISIDGGVNEDTLSRIQEAGANRFVVGSAILRASDPSAAYGHLVNLAAKG